MSLPPVERFGPRASCYARHRPGYPGELAALLTREAALQTGDAIADIGSGTGLSTALFLGHGFRVYAVEPNAAMRAAAEALHTGSEGFHSVDGTAESTTLPERFVRLITVGTAFHWFEEGAARIEFRRILIPGGIVAIFWNRRLESQHPFDKAYEQLLREHTEYTQSRHRQMRSAEQFAAFFGSMPREAHFPNSQQLDGDGLLGRVLSSSYAPLPGSPRYHEMTVAVRELFHRYQDSGVVTMHYDTCVYYAPLPSEL